MNHKDVLDKLEAILKHKDYILWGAGGSGKDFINFIEKNKLAKPIAFCDNNPEKSGTKINNIEVYTFKELMDKFNEFRIILSVDNVNSRIIRKSLNEMQLHKNISILEEYENLFFRQYIYDEENGLTDIMLNGSAEFKNIVNNNKTIISEIYDNLQDQLSKNTYKAILESRISGENNSLFDVFSYHEYFPEDIMHLNEDEVFVDCGAYNGDTIGQFVAACQRKYEKIVAIEPDKENLNMLKKNTQGLENLVIFNKGAFSKETTLEFILDGNGSAIEETAAHRSQLNNNIVKIETMTLDKEMINEDVSCIKMDIEGAELEALKGAEQILKQKKPKLAICLYHKPEDLWEIPKYLLDLGLGYKLYIRHYSTAHIETILYAV